MQTRVRYLVPPGIAEKDLPPEVRSGLRLATRIAARVVWAKTRKESVSPGDRPGTAP
ncbi:MAG TPA: hypothetical protein VD969_06240 [Symbiobacteriaceae bacterium]|nr:hypothetical protein [Symbiobacteriaceae bacterium]